MRINDKLCPVVLEAESVISEFTSLTDTAELNDRAELP